MTSFDLLTAKLPTGLGLRDVAALTLVASHEGCSVDWLRSRIGLTQSGTVRLVDRLGPERMMMLDGVVRVLRASLDRERAGALEQLAAVLPSSRDIPPGQAAVQSLERFLAAVQDTPDRWRSIFSLVDSSTPAFRARVEAGRKLVIAAFEDLVRWAVREGLDPDTDVEMLARGLFAVFWDAGRLVLAEPGQFPAERIAAFAQHTVTRYLR